MVANKREYIFTHHLRERYFQRTNHKYNHLQECKEPDCPTCAELLKEIRQQVQEQRHELDIAISNHIGEATECKWCLNNTGFMQWYYEKYGYDRRFEFLAHDGLLFVVVLDKGKKVIVTCVNAKTHLAGKQSLRPKFNEVKKRRAHQQIDEIMPPFDKPVLESELPGLPS